MTPSDWEWPVWKRVLWTPVFFVGIVIMCFICLLMIIPMLLCMLWGLDDDWFEGSFEYIGDNWLIPWGMSEW